MKKLLIGFLGLMFAAAAHGHHGWGDYDADKTLTLVGTIVESEYGNPHATIRLKTADKTWVAVLAPPFRMQARGLEAAGIKAGVQATVVGYPSRSKPEEIRAERIIVDGKTVELR